MLFDTIVAISTPIGEGAIGIIRMSGPEAFDILSSVFVAKGSSDMPNKQMVYGHILNGERIVDEVLAVRMFAPNTYTKENIVEINCHGGIVPMREILSLLLKKGARMADKGEFTKRAFLNGRIDLAQAESVMDLVSAKTKTGFDIAMNQLEGHLSKKIRGLRDGLISLMAEIEVSIDYPEEDIEEITYPQITSRLNETISVLKVILSGAESGKIIREGLKTVIVGKPNVGKSSLMNALLKDSRAIVTDVPGTTRDVIEEFMNIGGIPIKLIDTAGIRETEDIVEKIGVEKSKSYFNDADLVIFMLNAAEALSDEDHQLMSLVKDKHAIVIINKTDLPMVIDEKEINALLSDKRIIKTSVFNETGLNEVEECIKEMVYHGGAAMDESSMMSNTRHIHLAEKALENAHEALKATENGMPYDFVEVDIKDCILHLGHITGESVEDDLITTIFSNFCLGK